MWVWSGPTWRCPTSTTSLACLPGATTGHDAIEPLEADSWLRTIESKFGLLHCTEYQKTLYAT
jgi:hypothetical protein